MRVVDFLKSIPIKYWIIIAIAIFFFWQHFSGWAVSRKLYNMSLDQLREDKTAIVKKLEEDKETTDKIIIDLKKKNDANQKQRIAAQVESERLRGLVREKDAQILALKKEREAIIVPTDPDALVDEFRKRGYKPRVIIPF